MNEMLRSLSAASFLIAFLTHILGSMALEDLHICQFITMTPAGTPTGSPNVALIKLDFIRMPHPATELTPVANPRGSRSVHQDLSTTNSGSPVDGTLTPSTNNPHSESHENQTTTQATENSTARAEIFKKNRTDCHCNVNITDNATIRVLRVVSENKEERRPSLQVHESNRTDDVELNEQWSRHFNETTSVRLSVAHKTSTESYSVVIEVQGNYSNVTCTLPTAVTTISPNLPERTSPASVSPVQVNEEFLYEIPLLVLGGVMAVAGFLLISVGIALLRRYRKERKHLAKQMKNLQVMENINSNYEMIPHDDDGSSSSKSDTEDDTVRKSLKSSLSKRSCAQEDAPSTSQQFLAIADKPSSRPEDQRPSPGTARYLRMSGRRKKKQERKTSKKAQNSNSVSNVEDQMYSSVDLEYEDIPHEKPKSAFKLDTRVATPLLLLHNSGEQPHPLRRSSNTNQAQVNGEKPLPLRRTENPKQAQVNGEQPLPLRRTENPKQAQVNGEQPLPLRRTENPKQAQVNGEQPLPLRRTENPKQAQVNGEQPLPLRRTENPKQAQVNGEQPLPLRKSDNVNQALNQAQVKARTEMKVTQQENTYSHLNRGLKSHSYHMTQAATYDDADAVYSSADDAARCVSTDSVRNNAFSFPKLKKFHETEVMTEDNESRKSTSSDKDDQNHIYEAVEKMDAHSAARQQSSQSYQHIHEEPRKGEDSSRIEENLSREQSVTEVPTHGASQLESTADTDLDENETQDGIEENTSASFYDDAGPPDATLDGTSMKGKPKVEESSAEDKRRPSGVNAVSSRSRSPSIDGHNDHNNSRDFYCDAMNNIQSPVVADVHEDSACAHILSDYSKDDPEYELTSSLPDTNQEKHDNYSEIAIDSYPEGYVIVKNILYESCSLLPR